MLHLHIQDTVTNKSGDIQIEKTSNIVHDSVFISDILRIDPERDYIIIVLNYVPRYNDVNATLEFIETYDDLKNNNSEEYSYELGDLMRLWWAASHLQINLEVEEKLAKIIYDEIFTDKYTKNQVLSILYDDNHPKDPHLDLYLAGFYGYNEVTEIFRLPIDNKIYYHNIINDNMVSYDKSTGEIILYDAEGKIIKTINIDGMPYDTDIVLTYDHHIILYGKILYKIWIIDVTQCIEDFGSVNNDNKEYTKWLDDFFGMTIYLDTVSNRQSFIDNRSSYIIHHNKREIDFTPDATEIFSHDSLHYYSITQRYKTHPYNPSVKISYRLVENSGVVIYTIRNEVEEPIIYLYYENNPPPPRYKELLQFERRNFFGGFFGGYTDTTRRNNLLSDRAYDQKHASLSPNEKLYMFYAGDDLIVINIETKKIVLQTYINEIGVNFNSLTLFNTGVLLMAFNKFINGNLYFIFNIEGPGNMIGNWPDWSDDSPINNYSLLYNNDEVVKFGTNKVWFKKLLENI